MKRLILPIALTVLMSSCVTKPVTREDSVSAITQEQQLAAQQAVQAIPNLALKRKIAVARLSNETTYGKSLLTTSEQDKMAEKVSDMFVQGLINSGNYLVFERSNIGAITQEQKLTNVPSDLIGVDTLIVGSLTEFGRATTGTSGFLSSTKKQQATAKIDLRLVDVATGQVLHSVTGTGSASTETSATMGFGSVAGYDGSINDRAIASAVNASVEKISSYMLEKPWSADVLAFEDGLVYISGGTSQGVISGMLFDVMTKGKKVESKTTGTTITLPGEVIAQIRVMSSFGDTELEEGSVAKVVSGSILDYPLETIEVREAN